MIFSEINKPYELPTYILHPKESITVNRGSGLWMN